MKRRVWTLTMVLILGVLVFSNDLFAKVYSRAPQETALDGRTDQNSVEGDRNRALLAIWKEHVQAVTKERDEAYREIEELKNQEAALSGQGNVASGEVLKEKEDALRQLDFLKDKMTLLQKKYEALQAESAQIQENQVDPAQITALQAKAAKLEAVEKEFQGARDYFATYVKTLEAKQAGLEQTIAKLKSENDELQQTQAQQSKTINTLKTAIQSSLDSLSANCRDS